MRFETLKGRTHGESSSIRWYLKDFWVRKTINHFEFLLKESNNLSFMEASALDATNVETAFQSLIAGNFVLS